MGTAISCQGTLEMNNSSIKNSKGDGIRFSTYLQPILKNNSFIDIANYSVKNNRSSSFIIDATNNYWGSASGPALYDKTSKTWSADNGKITDGIEFLPFHRAPIFEEDTTSLNIDYADYITTPLESSKEATLKVSISNNTLKAKNCNIEVLCSWDNETWYSKGTKNITITAKQKNYAVNFQYSLFLSGDLHTKVVLYDNSDNSQTSEYIKSGTDHVNIGVVEKYDWYKFSESDLSNITIEGYISEIGGYAGESTETVYAITKRSDEQIWRQYELNNGTWSQTGVTYKTNPIEDTNASSSLKTSLLKSNEQYKSLEVSLPSLKDINESINKKKNDLANKFYNKIGINPSELSNEEKSMVIAGLASSVDDNMYFGVIKSTFGYKDYEDNYYYMKAKSYADTAYTAAYYTMSVGSAAEAARALNTAGVSGAMAFATSETGAGAVVFGTASVAELAEAAAMSGVSFVSYKMAERSKNIMTESVSKLKKTKGCKIRTVADDILDQMEAAGGHTLEKHVSKTNNDLVNIAITKGHDATSFTNKSTAIKSVKQNLRQNADVIEKWLANSSNQNPLVIDCKHVFETGYGAGAGMKNITNGLTKSEIYMVKDSSMTLGFKIITSYPIF
ncbi:Bacterial CdiA-CT RNAse A domain protein [anaerobic digester metagenome]